MILLFLSILNLIFGCTGFLLLHTGFLWLQQAGDYSLVVWVSHCGGFSCYRVQSLDAQGSVVAAPGLSCSEACGIFPDLCPLHLQADS